MVPETYGCTNPEALPLYSQVLAPWPPAVNAIWVVTTATAASRHGARLQHWAGELGVFLSLWWPDGMDDIDSPEDARHMADLIYRLVFHARQQRGQAPVLSLAGGRKTMSADLQRAGQLIGHRGLIHVLDRLDAATREALAAYERRDDAFTRPLPENLAEAFQPVLLSPGEVGSEALETEGDRLAEIAGPPPPPGAVPRDTRFIDAIEDIQRRAQSLLANYRLQLSEREPAGNFRALYALPARTVEHLRASRVGTDPARRDAELDWLRRLPKAELHCHLGGILNPAEMIEVARAEAERVWQARRKHPPLNADLQRLETWIRYDDLAALQRWLGHGKKGWPEFKKLRHRWSMLPEPLGVCAFLLAFEDRPEQLDALIFGELADPRRFHGIGIERYEALGDLQGSGLLQSVATLDTALNCLARQCREQNIAYLELRCSPLNMTRGELDGATVIDRLLRAAETMAGHTDLRLIFIASRHGDREKIEAHIELALNRIEQEAFRQRFVGFDLAGAEHVRAPAELREDFRPLRERVIHLTIHAGEGEDPQNIWQAAYELNADRIGHGLTLCQCPELLDRFRDRDIALEMCPSSNDQIVGYRDHLLGRGENAYPLADYLAAGLRVTINTDDPGMSRTDLTREYHKAAALTRDGLTYWQILQLVRNGFRAAFCDHQSRRVHLLAAEKAVAYLLTQDPEVKA